MALKASWEEPLNTPDLSKKKTGIGFSSELSASCLNSVYLVYFFFIQSGGNDHQGKSPEKRYEPSLNYVFSAFQGHSQIFV